MARCYNTVKTAKLVNRAEDEAARRAIDACMFLTPETERAIDLALGIGTPKLSGDDVVKPVTIFDEDNILDIMDAAGPSDAALARIEQEQE